MQSVMNPSHSFAQVPSADIQRSSFDRSRGFKTTLNSGFLVPILVDEVLPGDTYNVRLSAFARFATLIKPFMDNVYFDTFYFFVPNRLVWDNWEKFCGAQDNPDDTTDYLVPQVPAPATSPNPGGSPATVPGWAVNMLYDYMGIPTGVTGFSVNNLVARSYNLIWNDWFRDQNLQDSVVVDTDDGPDSPSDYVLLRRGKRHDYFTSSLPWPQKGPAVELPLGSTAPIIGLGAESTASTTGSFTVYETGNSTPQTYSEGLLSSASAALIAKMQTSGAVGATNKPEIFADLSNALSATVNEWRESVTLQQFYERDARGGTRYIEILLSHFRVRSPDFRLQRPEYLGGGSTRININPIAQTSETATTPQANLAAIGTMSAQGHGFVKSFVEHGHVIGLCSIRADLNYQQGLNKMWTRQTRVDFYWPTFANLGEQPVYNREIYLQGSSADADVFGYQERWAEYRYAPNLITGEFRSTYSQTLDSWHLAQKFSTLPVLGDTFIQDNPPIDRVVADETDPQFLLDCFHSVRCARPMPIFSVPGLTRF